MIDNDEAELAVDDLVRVIEYYGIRILRTEYDQIAAAAAQLHALDSLTEVRVDRGDSGRSGARVVESAAVA